jgi:hypothetical protein
MHGASLSFPAYPSGSNYWVDLTFRTVDTATPAPVPTAPTPTASPKTIWSTPVLTEPWRSDAGVTLGVKFRSSVPGKVVGVRFWKASVHDSGLHTGLLYSAAGSLLAKAAFTSESTAGWQEVRFSTPVAIAANTTYVAGYHSSTGWSAYTHYFTFMSGESTPLLAPRSGIDGANGLYIYGSQPAFPTVSRSANYWVDVLFEPAQ